MNCGYVALIGRPNVGKSTLMNHLLKQKISITSRKPQTTRHRILGISTSEKGQVIYLDTPGMHQSEQRALNRYLNRTADTTLLGVNVIVWLIDGLLWHDYDDIILKKLEQSGLPVILVVNKVDKIFRVGQLFSAAAFSLGHGGNDAQKTMGVMMMALAIGFPEFYKGSGGKFVEIPMWVALSAHLAIGLGTLSGGWRIVKTMGTKIAKLQPVGGFCAETAGALTLFGATAAGIPVSTTHTITGSIVGVGATKRFSAVKWGVAGRIVWAWVLTIPAAGFVAMVSYFVIIGIDKMFGN